MQDANTDEMVKAGIKKAMNPAPAPDPITPAQRAEMHQRAGKYADAKRNNGDTQSTPTGSDLLNNQGDIRHKKKL